MSPPKFDIFLIFSYFLGFKVLSRSAIRAAACIQVCYTRYRVSFYLWLMGYALKHCKVPKKYDQDCSL